MGTRRSEARRTLLGWRNCVAAAISALCFTTVIYGICIPATAVASPLTFDPKLSLTGGCTESFLDPVPDPNCPEGSLPPGGSFSKPTSVVTDAYGNVYVASFGQASDGSEGRIDLFDSSGQFLTELADPDGPRSLAVDSVGTLYVVNGLGANEEGRRVVRYEPTGVYDPANGEISYGNPPVVIRAESFAAGIAIAVDAANDHLFECREVKIVEYGPAAEGNPQLGEFGEGFTFNGTGLAIDAAGGRVYASGATDPPVIKVFELASPHGPLPDVDGSTVPGGEFPDPFLSLGVDEGSGHLFVYDGEAGKLFELTKTGGYVETFEHGFQAIFPPAQIGVDNGVNSPNGNLNPGGRYVFVPSNPSGIGHSYAFGPLGAPCEPAVASPSSAEVSETEAQLRATVDPCNLETSYVFEYTTQAQFEDEGFGAALVAGGGQLPAAREGTEVSASAEGLSPGTAYRFRVVATNDEGSDEAEGSFSTYPPEFDPESDPCPNATLRTGFSASLPDCRAYELVTPPDTNSRTPLGLSGLGLFFTTREASPSGDAVSFRLEGGTLPGIGGTGSPKGDPYLSSRGADGWTTSYAGPSPSEAPNMHPGSHSPDQGYSFWDVSGEGSAAVDGEYTTYVRYPDGHSALIGRGVLGTAPKAKGDLIGEDGSHIIFHTDAALGAPQLELNAPPDGTESIYDRTPDEVTHVVSLLPGDVTPGAGEHASYKGASLDGRGVAFAIGAVTYVRIDNAQTFEVASGNALTVGGTLTCSTTTTGTTNSFQWLRNGAPIAGATSGAYTTTAADEGTVIQCQVSSSNSEGGSRKSSNPVAITPGPAPTPPELSTPTVSGTPSVGQTLTCTTAGSSPAFQWLRNGAPIGGATSQTYLLQAADKGAAVQCEATYSSGGGSVAADSSNAIVLALPPTASANPSIAGIVSVGETLTCNPGTWANGPSFSYQWLRNAAPIAGATSQTYVLAAAEEGKPVQCRVTATNTDSTAQAVSARVVVPPPPGTTAPSLTTAGTVTGTPNVGAKLTCNTGSWAGSPNFARQWLRNGAPIAGATGSTYTLVAADKEKSIQCQVTATNAGGSVVAVNASASNGSRYVNPKPPVATATIPNTTATSSLYPATVTPAGLSAEGEKFFYVQSGNVFAFDTTSQQTTVFADSGNAQLVNVSEDGSAAYFVSRSVLTEVPNPKGDKAVQGGENLYLSREGAISFVGTVTERDVVGETLGGALIDGLGIWTTVNGQSVNGTGRLGADPSRTTPDGNVLLFQSRANLAEYDPQGKTEIYRYDAVADELTCLSCIPTGAAPSGDATLQRLTLSEEDLGKARNAFTLVNNLRPDGRRAFFESSDALVGRDTDKLQDVYEWEAKGVGTCDRSAGCISLISSGHSAHNDYLHAVSDSGNDIFFVSSDLLLGVDADETPSIYDARVGGGFQEPGESVCDGEGCRGGLTPPPVLPASATPALAAGGDAPPVKHCPKGKRRVKRHGRVRCVKRRHKQHRRSSATKGAGR